MCQALKATILKIGFDGCVGIDGRLAVNHFRRRVSRRRADDGFELLDTSHRVQGKADLHGIIDSAHFFRGEVSDKILDTALVDGEDAANPAASAVH